MKKLNSPKEVCEILGLGLTTVYKLMNEKKLHAIKVGKLTKITDQSITDFIENSPLAYEDQEV